MAQLTYREAVSLSIAQCMRKDEKVVLKDKKVSRKDLFGQNETEEKATKTKSDVKKKKSSKKKT